MNDQRFQKTMNFFLDFDTCTKMFQKPLPLN